MLNKNSEDPTQTLSLPSMENMLLASRFSIENVGLSILIVIKKKSCISASVMPYNGSFWQQLTFRSINQWQENLLVYDSWAAVKGITSFHFFFC